MTRDFDLQQATAVYEKAQRARSFVLLALCRSITPDFGSVKTMLEQRRVPPRDLEVMTKASVAAMTTPGSGLNELRNLSLGFLSLVNQIGALGRVGAVPMPFGQRIALDTSADVVSTWVEQGASKPLLPFRRGPHDAAPREAGHHRGPRSRVNSRGPRMIRRLG